VLNQPTASETLQPSIRAILAHKGKRRSFLRDGPVRNVSHDGISGVQFAVDLTSYRALPLSCIEGLLLKMDDEEVDTTDATLLLGGNAYRLRELSRLSHVWWFILDPGAFFVPLTKEVEPGAHHIDATLITVEPYITAGRFSFYHRDRRELFVEAWRKK